MNVFWFELKREVKNAFFWALALIVAVILFMKGMYPIFMDSKESVFEAMNRFPEPFMKAFAFQLDGFFGFEGFYGFIGTYMGLLSIIMSLTLSIGVFAREKKSKCMDFLMTKPISKSDIFFSKTIVCLLYATITNVIYLVVTSSIYLGFGFERNTIMGFMLSSLGIFYLQILFTAIGAFLALFSKKIRSVSGTAVTVGLVAFILTALANLLEKEVLYYFAVLKYFDPAYIMENGTYDWKYFITFCLITTTCLIAAYFKFVKMDVKSVT